MQFLQSWPQDLSLQCQIVRKNMLWGWTFKAFKTSGNWGYLIKRPSGRQGVNGSAARSKMTAVLTRVMKKWQRLSSGDWRISALRNKYMNRVQHPRATQLHHSAVWNLCMTITSQMNPYELPAHFNTYFRNKLNNWNSQILFKVLIWQMC